MSLPILGEYFRIFSATNYHFEPQNEAFDKLVILGKLREGWIQIETELTSIFLLEIYQGVDTPRLVRGLPTNCCTVLLLECAFFPMACLWTLPVFCFDAKRRLNFSLEKSEPMFTLLFIEP